MIQSSLKYEAHGSSTPVPEMFRGASYTRIYGYDFEYRNRNQEEEAYELERMLARKWKENYWWEEESKDAHLIVEEPALPLVERKVWTFNHSGVRPWTGKNYYKPNV